jgi:uncharacterized membrane protein
MIIRPLKNLLTFVQTANRKNRHSILLTVYFVIPQNQSFVFFIAQRRNALCFTFVSLH